MKRTLAFCALLCAASPAAAGGWHFVASLEGGAEFWTFTNETGDASPRRIRGNEIWITRSDEVNTLGRDGTCDFNNCRVAVSLDGHAPQAGERVQIRFSNGDTLAFAAPGGPDLMSNYDTAGMGPRTCSCMTSAGRNGYRSPSAAAAIASRCKARPRHSTRSSPT